MEIAQASTLRGMHLGSQCAAGDIEVYKAKLRTEFGYSNLGGRGDAIRFTLAVLGPRVHCVGLVGVGFNDFGV